MMKEIIVVNMLILSGLLFLQEGGIAISSEESNDGIRSSGIFSDYYDLGLDMNVSDVAFASYIEKIRCTELGDVNNDGFDDIMIGNGLVYGKPYGWTKDTSNASVDVLFNVSNTYNDINGHGDFNGDGLEDILIGNEFPFSGTKPGMIYLFFGQKGGWKKYYNSSDADTVFIGEINADLAGCDIDGVGDVNGDGFEDILIGAKENTDSGLKAGKAYLIFGKSSGWSREFYLSNADASFVAESYWNYCGASLSGLGDINGDGLDDFIIGSYHYIRSTAQGKCYIFLGKTSGWSRNTNISQSDASFLGEGNDNSAGWSVSGPGDVNGDGYNDILIAAGGNAEGGGAFTGQTYLIFGKSSGWTRGVSLSQSDASFLGENSNDWSGYSVSGAGDVNGDGYDDIIIGASHNSDIEFQSGKSYLIYGKRTGWKMDAKLSESDASFLCYGKEVRFGLLVSGAGDINGDGYDEFMFASGKAIYLVASPHYSEPNMIYDIKVQSDEGFEIDRADKGDILRIELNGLDSNSTRIDRATMNITFSKSLPSFLKIFLYETGVNTGQYKGSFVIPKRAIYLENITFSPFIDQTKKATVWVHTPILLEPNNVNITTNEDSLLKQSFWNFGYNPVIKWTYNSNAEWIEWDQVTHMITGTPDNSQVGEWWVLVNITDGIGHFDEKNYTITVINTPPSILTHNKITIEQDEFYSVDYQSDDEGVGNTKWSINKPYPGWLNFYYDTGILNGTPRQKDVGIYRINISIDDGNGGVNWTSFDLEVVDKNDPPEILTEPPSSILQGKNYYVQFNAFDEDDINTFEWTITTDAVFLEIDNLTGVVTGIPENDDVGFHFVNVTAEDLRGLTAWLNYTLEVIDVNDIPKWVHVPSSAQVEQGRTFTFDVDAVDVDEGDILSYSISSHPSSDISIDENTGEITWIGSLKGLTPTPNYVLNVEVSATDGEDSIFHAFTIQVIPNPSPTSTLLGPEDGSRITSKGILLEWEGNDDGEEPLRYTIYLGQSETEVSLNKQNVLWIEDIEGTSIQTGEVERGKTYYWTVIPIDLFSSGICSSDVFSFVVNIPPSLQEFNVQKAKVGTEFRLNLAGSDLNNDDLEFALEEGPDGMELVSGMISWTPAEGQKGTHTVNISLYDGYEYVYKEFNVEVEEEEIVTTPNENGFPIWIIILIILIILLLTGGGIGAFLFLKKRKMISEEEGDKEPPDNECPQAPADDIAQNGPPPY